MPFKLCCICHWQAPQLCLKRILDRVRQLPGASRRLQALEATGDVHHITCCFCVFKGLRRDVLVIQAQQLCFLNTITFDYQRLLKSCATKTRLLQQQGNRPSLLTT